MRKKKWKKIRKKIKKLLKGGLTPEEADIMFVGQKVD